MTQPKLYFYYRIFCLTFFFLLNLGVNAQFSYLSFNVGDLHCRPGFSIEKNCTTLNSFELGGNIIATHGRLENDVINYYGFEILFNKIQVLNNSFNGITFNCLYQYVKYPIGINVQNSILFENGAQFLRPEIGVNVFGVISLNYGYNFRLDEQQIYNTTLHHISLKLSLNISYGEYLNIVGKSSKKW